LAEREAELLPVEYFHVVYTLPARIADIAYQNKRVIYDLLFKAAAETTITIADDPKHLGARIGLTAVLHTWGSAMTHHPHVHMIVPGGGLSEDRSRWVPCRPDFVMPARVLSRLFRGLFLKILMQAHDANRLKFFGNHAYLAERKAFAAFLGPLRKIRWVVYAKPPFAGPEEVLRYLARYTHRPRRRRLSLQGLSPRWAQSLADNDAPPLRVHPSLPDARPPQGLPPHPPLWIVCQRQPDRQHRPAARALARSASRRRAGPGRSKLR
jgi:hypothetical protein